MRELPSMRLEMLHRRIKMISQEAMYSWGQLDWNHASKMPQQHQRSHSFFLNLTLLSVCSDAVVGD